MAFLKKLKKMDKILIGVGVALVIVLVVVIIFFESADKVTAPDNIPMLEVTTTTETTTTTTTTETTTTTTTVTYDYEMQIDMDKVKEYHEANEDVVGWVYVGDTVIDYPIVQSDDNDYYLERDWQGNSSHSGSIFEDFRGTIGETEHTLLYGHNMASGAMFHAVKNFKDESWGNEHIYFEVASLDTRYLYRIVACSVLNGLEGADFEYWNYITLDEEEYDDFIETIRDTALIWYAPEDDEPEYGDNLIVLQTCNSGSDDGIRCILFGQCLGEY
ncbi:MAG: class B sortase [Ruminococcus sp.]|nr:class B sortase [Ruminococcus sp.]